MQSLTISLPETVYRRLQRAAEMAGKPVDEIAVRTIQDSLPPLLDTIPIRYQDELRTMEKLSDDELWQVARSVAEAKTQRRHSLLLQKNTQGNLTDREREMLVELRMAADRLMVRKAYAYLLLKWRGYRVPSLTELEAGH
ncbi:MAG: hypothetical protein AB1791_01805 [Chloroflexota bacterium]